MSNLSYKTISLPGTDAGHLTPVFTDISQVQSSKTENLALACCILTHKEISYCTRSLSINVEPRWI